MEPAVDLSAGTLPRDRKRSGISRWSLLWTQLAGDSADFTLENRAFNAISIITFMVLLVLLPFNLYLGLQAVSICIAVLITILSVLYYYSRVRRMYTISMTVYAVGSYVTLILNYYNNSGSKGPTIYLAFLTFQLLIAFTKQRLHLIWMLTHSLVLSTLLLLEYLYPLSVPFTYKSTSDEFFDLSTSYLVILGCMYVITIYLRRSYNREKNIAEERAAKIAEQHAQISLQNEQLKQLNQEKNKMLSVLGHDLRSPLNAITTVLDFLTNYDVSEEQRMQLKRDLLHTTRNASDILANLLAWSSGQMKGLQPQLIRINISHLVDKVLQGQQLQADKKEITMQVDMDKTCTIWADFNMLELTLRNLINNALKFTERNGVVTIKADCQGDCVISVSDSGIGMSKEQVERLFTMDIHSTYGTNNETGIGLGLLLCREFTEIQQGKIWVVSQENKGSTFYIRLPAGPATE